jgi:hypothetical protein
MGVPERLGADLLTTSRRTGGARRFGLSAPPRLAELFAKRLRIRAMTGTFNWKSRSWQEAQLRNSFVTLFFSTALIAGWLSSAGPASAEQRSGVGPCRQGVLALIGMLDDGDAKSTRLSARVYGRGSDLRTGCSIESGSETGRNRAVQKARRSDA